MDIWRVISVILRIPLHLFLVGSFGASVYAAYKNIQGISWGTPILFGVILACWYTGVWMSKRESGGEISYG